MIYEKFSAPREAVITWKTYHNTDIKCNNGEKFTAPIERHGRNPILTAPKISIVKNKNCPPNHFAM